MATSLTSFPEPYIGYFSGGTMTLASDKQGYVLTDALTNDATIDGMPSEVNSVESFVSFVGALALEAATWTNPDTNITYVTKNRAENKIGAMFIIQTMRASGGTFDRAYPDAQDINEWKDRVRNYEKSGGQILWNAPTASYVNNSTRNSYRGIPGGGGHDISWYPHAGSSSPRGLIIFKYGNNIDYIIKRNCGNPMGNINDGLTYGVFSLTPSVTLPQTVTVTDSSFTVNPSTSNAGGSPANGTNWQLNKLIVPSGTPVPPSGSNGSAPCTHYRSSSAAISCGLANTTGGSSQGTSNLPPGVYSFPSRSYTTEDYPVGTRICFALSVMPRSYNSSQWSHSTPACVVVAKKPKAQVIGGDLWVGRGSSPSSILTSVSSISVAGSSRTFGSYSEYAVVASGSINGMASGSGYAGGAPSAAFCSVSLLTFNNSKGGACSNTTTGQYTKLPTSPPNIAGRFPVSNTSPTISGVVTLSDRASNVYRPSDSSQITLSGTTIPAGRWVVINAPGNNVRISGNINYADTPLSRVSDIPQVVIIANNISIDESVARVDAWLVAKGNIITCSATDLDGASAAQLLGKLHSGRCSQQLTVNGPVIADKLLLRRTAGAGSGSAAGAPAELFNFRPDAYLWLVGRSGAGRGAPTVLTRELPPKY